MVSEIQKLAKLRALAKLRQEIELAKLARLTGEDQRIANQQSDLKQSARAMRGQAPQSALEGRLQDRFGDWTDARLAALQTARDSLVPIIAMQKEHAARALGREDALARIGEQLADERRLEQRRRS